MKSRNPTERTINRWIAQGYGQGEGMAYKPFFHVRDVPSAGRSTILLGLKIPRKHHYLSDIEYGYHLLSEYSTSVIEIREQFALLPREETRFLAEKLNVRHPIYPRTGNLWVCTSDLVLTIQEEGRIRLLVLSCKPESDIDPSNSKSTHTLEKLLLEKTYWDVRGVEWRLVTEKMLPGNKIHNLDFFRGTMNSIEMDYLNPLLLEFISCANSIWNDCTSLNDFLLQAAKILGITPNEIFVLLGRSIWGKGLRVDLDAGKFEHEAELPPLLNR